MQQGADGMLADAGQDHRLGAGAGHDQRDRLAKAHGQHACIALPASGIAHMRPRSVVVERDVDKLRISLRIKGRITLWTSAWCGASQDAVGGARRGARPGT
ncbi:hypothetical protein Tamer19_40770 [Cupriavidus sp. TA19]|nr:hypothetical protein Tamer19_40770 [Cupriavidus sp. TA19]